MIHIYANEYNISEFILNVDIGSSDIISEVFAHCVKRRDISSHNPK